MLATPGPLPTGPDWVYEVKFDGIRLISVIDADSRLRLRSRNGKDLTRGFPELAPLAQALPADSVVDGELIGAGPGVPTLQSVAPRIARTNPTPAMIAAHPVRYMIFDAPRLAGRDCRGMPWTQRHDLLLETLGTTPASGSQPWQCSEAFDDGAALSEATAAQGLEGVVAKRRDGRYHDGRRTRDWIKVPHRTTTDLVILGWRGETGSRRRIGSLVLGQPADGAGTWDYVGTAGSGMTQTLSDALLGVLPSIRSDSPATAVPPLDPPATWVEPLLVVSVRHLGRTSDGSLRHPVIMALRPDLTAAELAAGDSA